MGGEVYTWGWKECIPSGKIIGDPSTCSSMEKEAFEKQNLLMTEQGIAVWSQGQWYTKSHIQVTQTNILRSNSITVSPRSHGSRSSGDGRAGDETSKRRRVSPARHSAESSSDETLSAFPCLVALSPSVRIASVAAGGRHTLVLSGNY